MLNRKCQIRKGITGLDPDKPEEQQLQKWMEGHPVREKRALTEEQKLNLVL